MWIFSIECVLSVAQNLEDAKYFMSLILVDIWIYNMFFYWKYCEFGLPILLLVSFGYPVTWYCIFIWLYQPLLLVQNENLVVFSFCLLFGIFFLFLVQNENLVVFSFCLLFSNSFTFQVLSQNCLLLLSPVSLKNFIVKEDETKQVLHISAHQPLDVVRWNLAYEDEVWMSFHFQFYAFQNMLYLYVDY